MLARARLTKANEECSQRVHTLILPADRKERKVYGVRRVNHASSGMVYGRPCVSHRRPACWYIMYEPLCCCKARQTFESTCLPLKTEVMCHSLHNPEHSLQSQSQKLLSGAPGRSCWTSKIFEDSRHRHVLVACVLCSTCQQPVSCCGHIVNDAPLMPVQHLYAAVKGRRPCTLSHCLLHLPLLC